MKALEIKLFRDLSQMKGQAMAIGAVIGCGIAVFIGAQTTLWSLQSAQQGYYEKSRFSDVFAGLKRAPLSIADRVADIPGVARVDSRIVQAVTLDIPSLDEPAVGRLLSLPDRGEPVLNIPHLIRGRLPEPDRTGEVLAEEAFVKAHGFEPGDTVKAVMNGRLQTLTIVGVGMSPEFITTVQVGSLFPDDKRFGIFWMRRRQMEAAFEMEGAFNNLTLSLAPHASEAEVIRRVDRLLARYGGLGANGRHLQISHRYITDEMKQLKTMSLIPPSIFLGVAAFLLNVALRRILSLQREQIAVLKAFGYTSLQVGIHYAGLVASIIVGGILIGSLLGTWMGKSMTAMYADFYRFPTTVFKGGWAAYFIGAILSLIVGLAGVLAGVRQAVRVPPAEAMRPEPPLIYRSSIIERFGLYRCLPQAPRMILRELTRRPIKALLTATGIGFACGILIIGNFGKDSIDYLIAFQFGLQERQDASVRFYESVPQRARHSLRQIQGVTRVEPFRSVPVRLRHGQFSRQTVISGLGEQRELFRLINANEKVVDLPSDGLLLSSQLAKILHLHPGDTVAIEVMEGARPIRETTVTGLVDDFAGTSAWMSLSSLNRLMREAPVISGAYIAIEKGMESSVYHELKKIPIVSGVSLQKVAVQSFVDTFAENLLRMRLFNIGFACVIAFGVVYNSARVSLSERRRELATLRVIGFSKGEVSRILLGELGLLTTLAIPLGCLLGLALCKSLAAALETDLYRIPFVMDVSTYVFAAGVIVIAAFISGLAVQRGINRLDLVGVLKSRE